MELVAALLLSASLGAMVFFSAVIAPTTFQALPEDMAGRFLRSIFPKYFLINGLAALVAGVLTFVATSDLLLAAILMAAGSALLWCRFVAIPVINEARDQSLAGDVAAKVRFNRWHRVTVLINSVEMLVLIGIIAVIALRG